ncbi:protein-L-isoaspartate(D-aspartate) O-methyltransferase [Saccharomonospora amisosensis]|uniref:Protein-L-isoaspartate O-methyltransferase n=1 Tax=Saccharomonospora amisosensis TaxID=1128677 RepID=A0A7X5ZRV3_9PSEU|nr:methyltransferase domain-containing protein [Saccharomonospora amisosensis]NIJ13238.1 protein-L-isoaspartate(D-aspartate) O-methyltransferase [Saccharomonospora amisosensis]
MNATSPESLRDAMVKQIEAEGYVVGRDVERALRLVERHHFVPDATLREAYDNAIVVTKRAADGQVLSCLSQPSIVALQLGQLDIKPGQRVLEIGAGAGYNAALLAHLVGPAGHVTSIDVDTDLVDHARRRLAAAGVGNVEVVLGDGALGHRPGAPFDRILATVGATASRTPGSSNSRPGAGWWCRCESEVASPARSRSSGTTKAAGAAWTVRCADSCRCGRESPTTRGGGYR